MNTNHLFLLLSGFAKSCIDTAGLEDKGEINKLAKNIDKLFCNRISSINQYEYDSAVIFIQNKVEPMLKEVEKIHNGETSPQILLILAVDKLLNEYKHDYSRKRFGYVDTSRLIDYIYSKDKFKPYIKSHSDFIERICNE